MKQGKKGERQRCNLSLIIFSAHIGEAIKEIKEYTDVGSENSIRKSEHIKMCRWYHSVVWK